MKRRFEKYFLLALDLAAINGAFFLALLIEAGSAGTLLETGWPFIDPRLIIVMVYSGVIVFIFIVNQLYSMNVYLSITVQAQAILRSHLAGVAGLAVVMFFAGPYPADGMPRVLVLFFAFSMLLTCVVRVLLFRTFVRYCCLRDMTRRTLLVAGATPTGIEIATKLGKPNIYGLCPVGFADDRIPPGTEILPGLKVIGRVEEIPRLIRGMRIDELVLCLEDEPEERYLSLLDECLKSRALVRVASKEFGVVPALIRQERYGDVPVFGIMHGPADGRGRTLKRATDIALGLAAIIILAPVYAAVALAVKLDSPGPVLYRQTRLGRDGRPFSFYKFRSMRTGSDADKGREEQLREFIRGEAAGTPGSTKIVDEAKITRVGRLIRKTSLDELPQLFNVVRGEMSLVGPRPCLPYEWKSYAEWHKRRLSVSPGCTGVWQVSGRSRVGFRDMVVLDLYYIYNSSLHLDLWLMLRTIPVMLFGTGGK